MECEGIVKYYDLGFEKYNPCNNPAKHKVEYTDVTGKTYEKLLCGVHLNSTKSWAKRFEKITGKEKHVKIEKLK